MNWTAAFFALGWVFAVVGFLGAVVTVCTIGDSHIWYDNPRNGRRWALFFALVFVGITGVFLAAGPA